MEKEPLDFTPDKGYFKKPSLLIRIQSVMIDALVLFGLMMTLSYFLEENGVTSGKVRGGALVLVLLYEPIMVALGQTIGQALLGLEVRSIQTIEEHTGDRGISLFASFLRFGIKIILGWLSLVTIYEDEYGQAIHDKVSNSVMVFQKS